MRKKCKCGNSKFCNNCSKIALVIMLKNNAKALHNGRNSVTRYSFLPEQKKDDTTIMDKMEKRLLLESEKKQGECFQGQFNVAYFIINTPGVTNLNQATILKTIKP